MEGECGVGGEIEEYCVFQDVETILDELCSAVVTDQATWALYATKPTREAMRAAECEEDKGY